MADVETKSIEGFEIKDADLGEVTAIVSTFNVVDRDGDVILPGAIRNGATVKLSGYGHDVVMNGAPPAGIGTVAVDDVRAVFDGKYFMDTQRGREAFAVVKGLGADSEWSIGYPRRVQTSPMTKEWAAKGAKRLIKRLEILEASPVFVGANALTGTVAVKASDAQADGASDEDKALVDEAIIAIKAKREADAQAVIEAKAKEDAEALTKIAAAAVAAEIARVEMETKRAAEDAATKAAAEAEAARVAAETAERERLSTLATKEFERLQRNMRQHRVA